MVFRTRESAKGATAMKEHYRQEGTNSRGETKRIPPPKEWVCHSEDGRVTVQLPLPEVTLLAEVHDAVEQFAGQVGMVIAKAVLDREVETLAGSLYGRGGADVPVRWGREDGYIVFAGRKVPILRPRLRQERHEVPLESYGLLQSDGRMQRAVKDRVVRGVSTRNYEGVIESFVDGYGIKRSSVSRHFVVASAGQVAELCERSLSGLALAVLMLDGIEIAGHVVVVAVGIDEEGRKHVVGLWDGATENAAVCKALLNDLERRGLDMGRKYLFVIDGSPALAKAIRSKFGSEALIQRCQVHKRRNVMEHLPEPLRSQARMQMNAAYGMESYEEAEESLRKTVKWLRKHSEGAARSLEEGLEETLTLHELGLPAVLRKSLSSTNIVESAFDGVRQRSRNVKRWRSVRMVRRWAGTMLLEVEKKFRRIRGHKSMSLLVGALRSGTAVAQKAVVA